MGVGVETRSVVRRIYNRSQTRVSARDRWSNVEGIFAVRRPELLTGRHILLVDDICTTGATAISCAETILKAVPDCRISYAALATPPDSNDDHFVRLVSLFDRHLSLLTTKNLPQSKRGK